MFEFTTTTHHPSIQATFIAKELHFTLMWLFEFFFKGSEGQYFCVTKQFQNCQKNFLGLEKGEKAMFIFPILDFSLDLEDQILVWRRQASSRLRLKR